MSTIPEYAPSALDQVATRGYGGVLACFPVELSDDSVGLLRDSLAKVIQSAPFLAGRVVEDAETGWAHVAGPYDIARDLLVVQDERGELDYNAWRTRRFPVTEVAHLWTLPPMGELPGPVLRVQLTRMDGGCTLGLLFHHSAIDGAGSGLLWAAWAAATRGDALPELTLLPRREKGAPGKGDLMRHPGYTAVAPAAAPGPPVASATTHFWFAEKRLKALKAAATSSDAAWISSHDALAALLWRHIAPTRRLGVIVNARARLSPPLPPNFVGNAIYAACAPAPAGTLQSAALAIRAAVRAVDAPLVEDFLGALNKLRRVYESQMAPGGPFLVTSWAEQGMHDLHWGIDGFRADYTMFPTLLHPEIAIVLPRRPGGLTVALGLSCEKVDALMGSDDFMRYAEWENGYKPHYMRAQFLLTVGISQLFPERKCVSEYLSRCNGLQTGTFPGRKSLDFAVTAISARVLPNTDLSGSSEREKALQTGFSYRVGTVISAPGISREDIAVTAKSKDLRPGKVPVCKPLQRLKYSDTHFRSGKS